MNMPTTPGAMGPSGPQFPTDGQFGVRQSPPGLLSPGAGGMGQGVGQHSPNHQQVLAAQQQQNRMMQARQMAMQGGLTSPRANANHSPFNPDPLLMSPHSTPQKLSPVMGKQLTPPFPQPQGQAKSPASMPSPQLPRGSNGQPNFNLGQDPLFSPGPMGPDRKPMGMPNSANGNSTSQYVRQELRAKCNARSQGQMPMSSASPQMNTSQNGMMMSQQQQPQQQSNSFLDFDGGLPADILESSK